MPDIIKEYPFLMIDYPLIGYPASIKLASIFDLAAIPGMFEDGLMYFNLEGKTITFSKIDNNNYQWQKEDLIWEDDYLGDEIDASYTHIMQGAQIITRFDAIAINLPFQFPFFNHDHDTCWFAEYGNLIFENKNGLEKPPSQEDKLQNLKSKSPSILTFTQKLEFDGKLHVKTESASILITYVMNPIDGTPNRKLEYQIKLWSNGNIRISYKIIHHFLLVNNRAGLIAGYQEEALETSFSNTSSGESSNSYPTGQVEFFDAVRFSSEDITKLATLLYQKFPNVAYDAIFVINDFPLSIGKHLASYTSFFNIVLGTGKDIEDYSTDNFDASHVHTILYLGDIDFVNINPEITTQIANQPVLHCFHTLAAHEFGHKWIQHLPFLNDGNGHWANTNDVTPLAACETPYYSVMGFNANLSIDPTKTNNGGCNVQTSSSEFMYGYSSIDLYLMGFLPPEEVTPFAESYSVYDVIETVGERIPSHEFSKKTFNAMILFITKNNPEQLIQNPNKLDLIVEYLKNYSKHFRTVTLGKGRMLFSDFITSVPTSIFERIGKGMAKKKDKELDLKEKLLITYNHLMSKVEKTRKDEVINEFYDFMVGSLNFERFKEDYKRNPEDWPRAKWLEQFSKISNKDLKKFRKEIDNFFPKKQYNGFIEKFQKEIKNT